MIIAPSFTVTEVVSPGERVEHDPFIGAVEEPRDDARLADAEVHRVRWPQSGVLTALRPRVAP